MPEGSGSDNTVEWPSLEDGYGSPASDMPAVLEDLWSLDPSVRRKVQATLSDRLGHSSGRSDASIAAVPVLNDFVSNGAAPDRFAVLQLLQQIAIGDEDDWLVQSPDVPRVRRDVARTSSMTVEQLKERQAAWVAAASDETERVGRERAARLTDVQVSAAAARRNVEAYDAVRVGVPLYVELLRSPEPAVRLYAVSLLAWFPEEKALIAPALAELLADEPYPVIANAACVAVGLCGTDDLDGWTTILQEWMGRDAPEDRWSACIGFALLERSPNRLVLEGLYDCLMNGTSPVPNWPFADGDLPGLAAVALSRLDESVAAERVDILIRQSSLAQTEDGQCSLFEALLEAAFSENRRPADAQYSDLNDVQRRAVEAIASETVPLPPYSGALLLRRLNLPDTQDDLRAWAERRG